MLRGAVGIRKECPMRSRFCLLWLQKLSRPQIMCPLVKSVMNWAVSRRLARLTVVSTLLQKTILKILNRVLKNSKKVWLIIVLCFNNNHKFRSSVAVRGNANSITVISIMTRATGMKLWSLRMAAMRAIFTMKWFTMLSNACGWLVWHLTSTSARVILGLSRQSLWCRRHPSSQKRLKIRGRKSHAYSDDKWSAD